MKWRVGIFFFFFFWGGGGGGGVVLDFEVYTALYHYFFDWGKTLIS